MMSIFELAPAYCRPYTAFETSLNKSDAPKGFLQKKNLDVSDSFKIGKPKPLTPILFGHLATAEDILEQEKKALVKTKADLKKIQRYFQKDALNLDDSRGLYNVYFDTPNSAIDKAGLCVRLRMNIKDKTITRFPLKPMEN